MALEHRERRDGSPRSRDQPEDERGARAIRPAFLTGVTGAQRFASVVAKRSRRIVPARQPGVGLTFLAPTRERAARPTDGTGAPRRHTAHAAAHDARWPNRLPPSTTVSCLCGRARSCAARSTSRVAAPLASRSPLRRDPEVALTHPRAPRRRTNQRWLQRCGGDAGKPGGTIVRPNRAPTRPSLRSPRPGDDDRHRPHPPATSGHSRRRGLHDGLDGQGAAGRRPGPAGPRGFAPDAVEPGQATARRPDVGEVVVSASRRIAGPPREADPPLDVERITDQVAKAIDRRLVALASGWDRPDRWRSRRRRSRPRTRATPSP